LKTLSSLNKYLYKYRWKLLLGTLFVTVSNIFGIWIAPLVRQAMDKGKEVTDAPGFVLNDATLEQIGRISLNFFLLIVGSTILKGIFMFFMRQTIIVVSRHIEYDLKDAIYSHYQKLSQSFYRKNNTGDLMNRISEDVGRVRMYLGPAIMYVINTISLFAILIPIMLSINVELTLYALIPLPILAVAIYYVNSIIQHRSDSIQKQLSKVTSFTQEAFSGIKIIKAFGKEQASINALEEESEDYKKKSMGLVKVDAMFFPLIMMLVGLSTLLTIFIGGKLVIAGQITFGNIAEFVIYVNMLTWPVASLGYITSLVQRAAASQARINEFLNTQPEIVNKTQQAFEFENTIEFKNVSFRYDNAKQPALKNVSFKINKGETFGIIGSTGSGKSTIAALLLRLYDVQEGEILIDGKPISQINLEDFRERMGYVPQDVFLFSDSIQENIAFGLRNRENSLDSVKEAAKQADIYDNIMEFPKQFATMVGERGVTLSGGQKQRVAIARAIIKSPEILLLDDCLSAVDTKTEANILSSFKTLFKDKTAIIISHRISSVIGADNIIVLDDGEIIETGNHKTLFATDGKYAELYNKQMREEVETIGQ
jgi:ATP-binding cassette, subfamily B, multidrug efflux pump